MSFISFVLSVAAFIVSLKAFKLFKQVWFEVDEDEKEIIDVDSED